MKLTSLTQRKIIAGIRNPKGILISSFFCMLFSTLGVQSVAYSVMPPGHYEKEAENSAIKAIAEVKDVIVLSETEQNTRKKVVFALAKPFTENIPETFTGICYSVDHKWQKPGVGGTIYYYPIKGSRVLVTISDNGGSITSYTPLEGDLEAELLQNGLCNIAFRMGHAVIRRDPETAYSDHWFTFHLDNRPAGFLHISRHRDPNEAGIVQFKHEFVVGVLDGDRRQYLISTQSRDDDTLTLQWLVIETREITPEGSREEGSREIGFRVREKGPVAGGVLVKGRQNAVDVPIPDRTTTDLLLFDLVEQQPFHVAPLSIHVIETLELNLKKGISLVYSGIDPGNNLHRFEEQGPIRAEYWLNERHELMEVHWDKDKVFHRSTEEEATTILQ